jgi:hypothetical protein
MALNQKIRAPRLQDLGEHDAHHVACDAGSILAIWSCVATAQPAPPAAPPSQQQSFGPGELVDAGQRFFGGVSQGFAGVIEKATSQWGLPNGYVLGEEAGGAFIGGLRYGEGTLYTKNAGDLKVFWQGPLGRLRLRRGRRADHDDRLQPPIDACDLSAIRGPQWIGLLHRRIRDDRLDGQRCRGGSHSLGSRLPARSQPGLPKIHTAVDMESVLGRQDLDNGRGSRFAVGSLPRRTRRRGVPRVQ